MQRQGHPVTQGDVPESEEVVQTLRDRDDGPGNGDLQGQGRPGEAGDAAGGRPQGEDHHFSRYCQEVIKASLQCVRTIENIGRSQKAALSTSHQVVELLSCYYQTRLGSPC